LSRKDNLGCFGVDKAEEDEFNDDEFLETLAVSSFVIGNAPKG
jgi:hypothetical protein